MLVAAGVHDVCIQPSVIMDHGWQLSYVKKIHHPGNFNPGTYDNDVAGTVYLIIIISRQYCIFIIFFLARF